MKEPARQFTEEQYNLARIAKSLSHPVRIAILQMLSTEERCYHGDMSQVIPVAKSTLSQHLKELKDAGLIQGEITPPTTRYCIDLEGWSVAKREFGALFREIKREAECCSQKRREHTINSDRDE